MTPLPIHICAGLLALSAGAVAMAASKGGKLHRKSGMVFVFAMLIVSSSALLIAIFVNPSMVNVTTSLLTFYLVSTAMLTVRYTVDQARGLLTGLMLVALTLGVLAFSLGFDALNQGRADGLPAPPLFMFGGVALLGALLDARMLLTGSIQGAHRLARHLWRMSFALWFATSSFFLGQAKLFPEPLRKYGVPAIPVVLVLVFMLYWLVRVLLKRGSAVTVASPTRSDAAV